MPLYINTNIASLNTQRSLLNATGDLNKVFARLSSGLRINTAGDDAAGLGISNRMTSQIRGLTQAVRNANDGISVSQVAEGALEENSNMLQRINELSVQAANATNSDLDRNSLQQEVSQLLLEIERVAQETEFNNWPMLNGKTQPLVFQVGAKEDQTITVNLADARAATLLAQPVLADPNSKESVKNPKITGQTIKAPEKQLEGSRLFSSKASMMVESVANADTSKPSPATTLSTDVTDNMLTAIDNGNVAAVAAATDAAVLNDATGVSNALGTAIADGVTREEVVDNIVGSLLGAPDAAVKTAVTTAMDSGGSAATIAAAITVASPLITGTQAKGLASAALAAFGRTNDGSTQLAGGAGKKANVIGAWVAETTVIPTDPTIDSDQARILAAASYEAARSYAATENVPTAYATLAGDTTGAIATAGTTANVVDNAVIKGTTVKDVPVGNILAVIAAFNAGVSINSDIETLAKAALAADQSKKLTLEEAKIIAAAGLSASAPGGTVAQAVTAGKNMSLVLAARDAAAAAASEPKPGEYITVPKWLMSTSANNKATFPPTPLVDLTGASIPTDPTLEFNPPTTDATNPPLSGQEAAGRMIEIVKRAIDRVSFTRAELGAIQNRFDANVRNLSNVVENVSAARSRILDADVAAETANLTRLSIMQQAGTAILAQANQQPQLALQLLR